MNLACCLVLALCGALFDVSEFPLAGPASTVIPVPLDSAGCADLVVFDEGRLTIYWDAQPESALSVEPPPATSAVDFFDLNGDGAAELVLVAEERIFSWALSKDRPDSAPQELFTMKTQFARVAGPFPYVMAFKQEGKALLGLPGEGAFEVRDTAGTIVASAPMDRTAPLRASYGRPFSAEPVETPTLGDVGALEIEVTRSIEVEPALPILMTPGDRGAMARRRAAPPTLQAAKSMSVAFWPWFSLGTVPGARTGEFGQWDVLYAYEKQTGESLIRLRSGGTGGSRPRVGPPRAFAGTLLNSAACSPDFNADGYVDLLLWDRSVPGMPLDRLAKTFIWGRRPLKFTAHYFEPKRAAFSPSVSAALLVETQLSAQEVSGPIGALTVADFNADGRSDLGGAVGERLFNVWLTLESGFEAIPAFTCELPEQIQAVEFQERLAPEEGCSLGLRGERALYLLRPRKQAPAS